MPSQGSVALSQSGLQLPAMLAARVQRPAVDPVAGPVQPVPRLDVEVLAEEELLELGLQSPLRCALGPHTAVLASKDQPSGHQPKLLPVSTGLIAIALQLRVGGN